MNLQIWEDEKQLREIRDTFAPTLTVPEFNHFVGLGKALGLNPFNREIWAVKYGQQCSIFVGRDGYRVNAQRQDDYERHVTQSVYSNDLFQFENFIIKHSFDLKDRGVLLGAYCLLWKKNLKEPFYKFVELKEYKINTPNWHSKPATMIEKVAESQCLRLAYQGLFNGTYHESESFFDGNDDLKKPIEIDAEIIKEPETWENMKENDVRFRLKKMLMDWAYGEKEEAEIKLQEISFVVDKKRNERCINSFDELLTMTKNQHLVWVGNCCEKLRIEMMTLEK